MPQFVSNNVDFFDYDSIQPNPEEVTSVPSAIDQSTANTHNKEDNFIIYSSTSNRSSMSTPKDSSDSNMITAQVTETTEIDSIPSENEIKADDIAPTPYQDTVKNVPEHNESSVETSITEDQVPVTLEESMKNIPKYEEPSVESIVGQTEDSAPTQQSVKSVAGHEESSVEPSVTKVQVSVSTEESAEANINDSEHKEDPPINQIRSTNGIEATNAPVTTIIEDIEEKKTPNSATSSCYNNNPSLINEPTEQSTTKSCFPDFNLAEVHNDNLTANATTVESPTENKQETTTIRLCGSCDNLNDVNNIKPIETEEHVVAENPENYPTIASTQSTTNIDDTILPTSTESFIQSEFTTVMDSTFSVTEPSVYVETTTIIQGASQPSTSEMNQPIETTTFISQPNNFEMTLQLDPNGSSATFESTTTIIIIDEIMPSKMSEINESEETTTIISKTTADPEMTTHHDLNSDASILTSYHVLKHLIVLCVITIFQHSPCCI